MPFTGADPAHYAEVREVYRDTVAASGAQERWHSDGLLEIDPEEALFWLLVAVDLAAGEALHRGANSLRAMAA